MRRSFHIAFLSASAIIIGGLCAFQPAFADGAASNDTSPKTAKPAQVAQADTQLAQANTQVAQANNQVAEATRGGRSAIEEVVVLGQRTPRAVARAAQQQAPNLINILTIEDIKKLPEVSVAEAVRRVPGVSMESDEGEGRYVNCRGFDADLNSTTFGGLRLPPTNNASPFGGYRAVTLDSIPIGLVGAITVTKSNLPSMDAEDLGCTIEITPRTAPPGTEPFLQGNIGAGYEPLRGTPIIDVAATGGGHFGGNGEFFDDGPFSLVLTASYYDDQRGFDDVEPAYFNNVGPSDPLYGAISNIQQRDYELHRVRHSFGIDLGYEPNENNSYYIRAFDAGYTERYWRQFLNLTPDGNTSTLANGKLFDTLGAVTPLPPLNTAIQKAFRDEKETSIDRIAVAGGKNIFGPATLDYRIGYTIGTYHKPYDYNSAFDYVNGTQAPSITYGLNGEGHTPLYTIAGADYTNPANYTLDPAGFSNSIAENFDQEYSAAANLEVATNWLGADTESIKFGGSARMRHKNEFAQPYTYPSLPALSLVTASSGPNETYYDGQYQNGPDIRPGYLQSRFGHGIIDLTADPYNFGGLSQYIDAKENVFAGYAQYSATFGKLSAVGGVRVEQTIDMTHAWATGIDSSGNELPPVLVNGHQNYTDFFPSFQARYEIEPDLIARATYSSTLARPGFNQSTPATTFDLGGPTLTTGNPNLKPATADSFDVSLEKYLEGAGIVSIGFFDKEIQNYILPNVLLNQPPPPYIQNIGDIVTVVTYTNAGPSYSRGVEFNWEERFTDLPGILGGLGAGFNYTYVDSSVQLRPGEWKPLPSTSARTWNADIFYEKGGLSLKLAAYSTSADLFGIGGDRIGDVFNASRTSMDFGSSYQFADNYAVYFNVKNLLNTPHAFYVGSSNRPIQREFYLQTFQIGVNFDF